MTLTEAHVHVVGPGKSDAAVDTSVLLYVRSDGYPDFMVEVIPWLAEWARGLVTEPPMVWWVSDVVASIMVAWSTRSISQPVSERPENPNGTGWGVPSLRVMPTVSPTTEYWYTLELTMHEVPKLRYGWDLWMYDLRKMGDLSPYFRVDDLEPTDKIAQSVDGVVTLFHPQEVSYPSAEFIERASRKGRVRDSDR